MADIQELSLSRLKQGFWGVTRAFGEAYFEACLICLGNQNHQSGVELALDGEVSTSLHLNWNEAVSNQMRDSWRDLQFATEFAACGTAFLLMQHVVGYTVIRQSQRGTGVDYWMGTQETDTLLVQEKARLEVSGILTADNLSTVKSRAAQKRKQVLAFAHHLPVYVVVVEFSRPIAYLEQV
jgi:hypothetical protein